jgi:hypothetical protein
MTALPASPVCICAGAGLLSEETPENIPATTNTAGAFIETLKTGRIWGPAHPGETT